MELSHHATLKYRLFPTAAQRTAMQKALDACRWVYNKTLEVRRNAWKEQGVNLSHYDANKLLPEWKSDNSFLKDAFSQSLQDAQKRVDLAFKSFFRRIKSGEENPGYPRFKSYSRYHSFTYPQRGFELLDNERLRLSKIGDVKIKLHRPLIGKCKTLTIYRDRIGNWYAYFTCVVEPQPLPLSERLVGIDLGLSTFATLSDGAVIKRQRWAKRDERDIARLQRKKERYPKGSPEFQRVVRALCHAYRRAANRRHDFAHQQSRQLINTYQFIALEKLDISNMQAKGNKNKTLRKGITDVAWGQFVQFVTYKAEWAGRDVVLVDPRGTTQECSDCGAVVPKDLFVRVHHCSNCGLRISRDLNAAHNILARGLASLDLSPKSL